MMDVFQLIAERKIAEAMEEGAFDHLDGAGAPLPDDGNPFEDPASRMANRLLKNNGFAPSWIEESKELDREAAAIARIDGDSGFLAGRVAALNRRIERFNLTVPIDSKQKRLIRLSPGAQKPTSR